MTDQQKTAEAVDRLAAVVTRGELIASSGQPADLLGANADEIERLRQELEALRSTQDEWAQTAMSYGWRPELSVPLESHDTYRLGFDLRPRLMWVGGPGADMWVLTGFVVRGSGEDAEVSKPFARLRDVGREDLAAAQEWAEETLVARAVPGAHPWRAAPWGAVAMAKARAE